MPKGTTFDNQILALIFNATAIPDLAENDSSSPNTDLYLSLHTANPAGASQATSETAYTNYARIAVVRTTSGWDVPAGGVTSNAALAQFAQCGVTGATITHVGIGTASSGAGNLLYSGALSSPLVVSNGIQPQFAANALTVTES